MTTSKVWYSLVCDNSTREDKRIGDPIAFEGSPSLKEVAYAFVRRFQKAGCNAFYYQNGIVILMKYNRVNDSLEDTEEYSVQLLTDAQVAELPEFCHCDSPTCRYEECAGADENPRKETFGLA